MSKDSNYKDYKPFRHGWFDGKMERINHAKEDDLIPLIMSIQDTGHPKKDEITFLSQLLRDKLVYNKQDYYLKYYKYVISITPKKHLDKILYQLNDICDSQLLAQETWTTLVAEYQNAKKKGIFSFLLGVLE